MKSYQYLMNSISEAVMHALSTDIDDKDIDWDHSDIDNEVLPFEKEFAGNVQKGDWKEVMNMYNNYKCRYKVGDHSELVRLIKDFSYYSKGNKIIDYDWIDTTYVTDMSNVFNGITCKINISRWNTSRVTNMNSMFYGCTEFNSDLSHFDVSNVTDMTYMFCGCKSFNQDISMWNVQNVTHTIGMFEGCEWFEQNLNDWGLKFKNLKNTFKMFKGCVSYNGKMDKWKNCMSTVTNMASMFESCISFKQNLNKWDIRSAKNVNKMFRGTKVDPDNVVWDLSRFENVNLF